MLEAEMSEDGCQKKAEVERVGSESEKSLRRKKVKRACRGGHALPFWARRRGWGRPLIASTVGICWTNCG